MAARIIGDIHPLRVHVLEVLHLVRARFHEQPFLDEDRHGAGGRHDDIEAVAALTDFGERGVVTVVVGQRHLDLVGFLELLDQFGIGVIAPVEDVEFALCMGKRGRGKERCQTGG
ncbi:hypothetical protein D3C80_367460 [compost metagenome]